jgi:hypothetical protein
MRNTLFAVAALIALAAGAGAAIYFHRNAQLATALPARQTDPAPEKKLAPKEPPTVVEVAPVAPAAESPAIEKPSAPLALPMVIAPSAPPAEPAPPRTKPQPLPELRRPAANAVPAPRQDAPVDAPAAPIIPKEVAREALFFVGADPEAETVWFNAINDPNLSDKVREDLIEDLNEEGFADPKNLTPDDLPLIVNRLAIIEQLAPDAMDYNNYKSFMEAYKDLVNMYGKLVK